MKLAAVLLVLACVACNDDAADSYQNARGARRDWTPVMADQNTRLTETSACNLDCAGKALARMCFEYVGTGEIAAARAIQRACHHLPAPTPAPPCITSHGYVDGRYTSECRWTIPYEDGPRTFAVDCDVERPPVCTPTATATSNLPTAVRTWIAAHPTPTPGAN